MIVGRLVKECAHALGFEVTRRRSADLPFVHRLQCDRETFAFWIANEHTRRWWYKPEIAMNAELRSLKAMCRPGSVVFDVGAHHGMMTVLLARWVGPEGHVHAFEANPTNALVLAGNIALNNLRNCTPVHAVIGGDAGVSEMAGEVVSLETGRKRRAIERITLDEYCDRAGVARVDVLKIDVEGFEGEVLKGCRRVLEQKPMMDIELHIDDLARFGTSAGRVLALAGIEAYAAGVMVRPEWDKVVPLQDVAGLPASGVVNVFLWPR
jgi:FkbM family methyltransferase